MLPVPVRMQYMYINIAIEAAATGIAKCYIYIDMARTYCTYCNSTGIMPYLLEEVLLE